MAKVDMADELENDLEQTADTVNDILDATGVKDKIKDKVKDTIKDALKKDKSDSPGKDGENGEGDRSGNNNSDNNSNSGENSNEVNNTGDSQAPNDTNAPENADSSSANNENSNLNDGENTSNSNNNSNDKNQSANSSDSNANKLGRTDENTVDPSKSSKLGRTDKNTVEGSNAGAQSTNTASGTGTANASGAGASAGSSGTASTATGAGAAGSGTAVSAKAAKDAKSGKSGKDGKSEGTDKGSGSNGDKSGKDSGGSGNGSKQSIADKAAEKKAASGGAKAGAEAGSKGAASAGAAGAEAGASAGASAGAAGASAGASAGAGAAGAAAGAGAGAGGAAAAAGPAGWAIAAISAINQITNSTDSMAGAAALVIVVVLLPVLVILVGIVFILSAAMILAVLLMNAFQFVFSFLIPDEEEELSEDSTPEERYRVIAKIIRKKVKDDYDAMISKWKDDLSSYKNDEDYNEFGLALEYWGMPTPNLSETDAASTKYKIGTGHNNTVAAMYDGDWAYDQYYYLNKFPRGVKDKDNNYLDGDEPYFDYGKSLETMGNESNNGSIKNMAYLVAGYNASRCELPITESGQSWFSRTFKSYYWDITSQSWWNDLLDFIGFDTYFEYSASLNATTDDPEIRYRKVQVYDPCYWENVTVEKEFTWNVTIDVEPLNSTYGIASNFITDTTGSVKEKTSSAAIKIYYQDKLDYGVAWDSSFELTDEQLLTSYMPMSTLNEYKFPEDKFIATYGSYYVGNGKTVSIDSLDSSGKASATASYTNWFDTGTTIADTTGATYDTVGTNTVGSKRYKKVTTGADVVDTNLFKTTTVYDSGTTNSISKPTMSDVTSGANPYYVTMTHRTEVGEQTADGTYDSSYQTIETVPCEELVNEEYTSISTPVQEGYRFEYIKTVAQSYGPPLKYYKQYRLYDEYIITSHYWDWTKYRYEYKYAVEEYQEKGIKVTFTVSSTPTSTVTDTAAFNKSTYYEDEIPYEYYYLKASSKSFKNSQFVEVMFEKGNSYYDKLPTEIVTPSFVNADGTRTSAQTLTMQEAYDADLIDVIPNSTNYDGGKKGGIADWPYYSCVNGYEYTCGASGTKLYCYSRPDDSKTYTDAEMETLDEYNTSPDGDFSCGCGAQATQEEMGEDGEKAAVNKTIKSHMCDIMTFSELIVDENTGDPILDENGNKQYQQVTKVKTVQDRIEELVADFKNIIDGVEAEENISELGIVKTGYGNVSDLTIFTIETIEYPYNSVTNSGPSGYCGSTYAIGKISWSGEEARAIIKAIYEKNPEMVEKEWSYVDEPKRGDHYNDPFFMNDANEWNNSKDHVTCKCNTSNTFSYHLKRVLYSTDGQDIQAKFAGEKIEGIINKLNETYGITDPAVLCWLTILCNECGWDTFNAKYSAVVTIGMSNGGTLPDIYAAYLAAYGGDNGMQDDYFFKMNPYYAYLLSNKDELPETWNQKTTIAYGSIALPNEKDVIYFNQATDWNKYGELDTATKGSGPTVCAMLGASLVDVSTYNPNYCISWAFNNGCHDEINGSTHDIIEKFCESSGLKYEYAKSSTDIANALSSGKLVVMLLEGTGTGTKYHYGEEHFIILRGITDDGKILVADPGSLTKSENETGFDLSQIWNNRKNDGCTNEHTWIISK